MGTMRRGLLLVLAVLLLLPPPAAAPHIGGTSLGQAVTLSGCRIGVPNVTCTFTATPWDRNLIFFRFDFNADGTWEFPSQVGAGPFGRWTTLSSVTWFLREPFRRACVQAWDGVSTRTVDGQLVPRGPIGCTDFVRISPRWWNHLPLGGGARAFVRVTLEVPAWLSLSDFDPARAELEGMRPIEWHPGPGAREFTFLVDRLQLWRFLGIGSHDVHFTIVWAGATFTGAGHVLIL